MPTCVGWRVRRSKQRRSGGPRQANTVHAQYRLAERDLALMPGHPCTSPSSSWLANVHKRWSLSELRLRICDLKCALRCQSSDTVRSDGLNACSIVRWYKYFHIAVLAENVSRKGSLCT
eukprot:3162224-Pleurochrysis_carterae.AAC.1